MTYTYSVMRSKGLHWLHPVAVVLLVCAAVTWPCYRVWVANVEVHARFAGLQTAMNASQVELKSQKRAMAAAVANATATATARCEAELRVQDQACTARTSKLVSQCEAEVSAAEARAGEAKCRDRVDTAVELAAATETAACDAKLQQRTEDVSVAYSHSVLEADARALRAVLAKYNASMAAEWAAAAGDQPERGILILAGPEVYMVNAFVSLWAIRRHWNCSLPVAIVYWGETEAINQPTRDFFHAELGKPRVRFIDAAKEPWPAHHRQLFLKDQGRRAPGWALKLAASYLVPFQQILYFDSDSAPLVSPDSLFELPGYKKSGALFWPDTPCSRPAVFDELIGMGLMDEEDAPAVREERQTEAGQWLLDRRRHREPLEYIMLLATHADFTFARAFGDKDLFRAGFALAGAASDYVLSPDGLGFAWGPPDAANNGSRLMRGYVQFSAAGQPLFHHRAGWETKYNANRPEGRPLDAFSGPLPCAWTDREWPFEEPGARDDAALRMVDPAACPYALDESFGEAVAACGGGFKGEPGQRMPIYDIDGSVAAGVHRAQEAGWARLVEVRSKDALLFSDHD